MSDEQILNLIFEILLIFEKNPKIVEELQKKTNLSKGEIYNFNVKIEHIMIDREEVTTELDDIKEELENLKDYIKNRCPND